MKPICDYREVRRTGRTLALCIVALLMLGTSTAEGSLQNSIYTPVGASPFLSDGNPYAVAFDPVGGVVADANYQGNTLSVYAIDPDTANLVEAPTSPVATGNGPVSLAFSPNGALLATANLADGTVAMYSVDAAAASSTAQTPPQVLTEVAGSPFTTGSEPYSVAFSSDGSLLATANFADGTVSLFSVNIATGALTPVPGSPFKTGASPRSVAFSPAGLLATANGDNSVSVFSIDPSTHTLEQVAGSPFADGGEPYSVAFSPGGGLLATANAQANEVAMFVVGADGRLTAAAGSPFATDKDPLSVSFSPNGAYVATANFVGGDTSIFNVNALSGALTPAPGSPIPAGIHPHGTAFSPDWQEFAVANAGDGTLSVYQYNLPTVQITAPAAGSTFALDEPVEATYTCADGPYGAGIASCGDGHGGVGGTGTLDTSTLGTHTYTVTAVSFGGLSGSGSITYNVVLQAPTNVRPPSLRGSPLPGKALQCVPGQWTGRPTAFGFRWRRGGALVAGATKATYRLADADANAEVSCEVTASNQLGRSQASRSAALFVKAPGTAGCPAAAGALKGRRLGLIELGMTRAAARRAYRRSRTTRTADSDYFCVAPTGISVGYPTKRALGILSPGARRALSGRVVWAVTGNPYYTLQGIKPGLRLSAVRSRLTHALLLRSGRDPWYLLSGGPAAGLVQFGRGVAQRVGIVASPLVQSDPARRQLLAALP